MRLMSRFCSASSSGATSALAALQWSLPNLPPWHFSASPMQAISLILILSDTNMPGMSGLELPKTKALRPGVPIIMITAYGDAETKRQVLEHGAEALLIKPIDFGTLVALKPRICCSA
jgi:CheY-like chemotaxis protein